MVNEAQVSKATPTAAAAATTTTRRPWNMSTRLAGDKSRRGTGGDDGEDKSGQREHYDHGVAVAEGGKNPHSRCTSPTCQSRRSRAVMPPPTTTTPPISARQDVCARSDKVKERQQSPERVGHSKQRSSKNPTRAMIERAFDAAFTSTLQDPGLTALDASVDVSMSASPSVSKPQPERESPRVLLEDADDASKQWRAHYLRRREQRQRAADEQQARDTKAAEFQRLTRAARVEYQQRKLAIQSLQARLQREIQFLQTTAAELSHRESLLDEAFEGYEEWLRGELESESSNSNARAG